MYDPSETIVLWDHHIAPPDNKTVWLLKGYEESDNHRSILKVIEQHSDSLREEYLKWIYNLGELNVNGKRLIEHLKINSEFSFWWMTLIAEKSIYKSNTLFDSLRVLAMVKLFKKEKPYSVKFYTNNKMMIKALEIYCDSNKISFSYCSKYEKKSMWNFINLSKNLPFTIKAIFSLLHHTVRRWPLRQVKVKDWYCDKNSIFLFSYFIHFDKEAFSLNQFYSKQWEVLPELLHSFKKRTNWIHNFLYSKMVSNTSTGIQWLKKINNDSKNQGLHTLLDSFLSIKLIFNTIRKWLKLYSKVVWVNKPLERLVQNQPNGWLWPLFKKDWNNSIFGPVGIENILWIELLDKAFQHLPKQKLGLYLCENQAWERAFIYFWKKHGHGKLIAVPHSTIRYWDLRYFNDKKVLMANGGLSQPLPDKIALNGPAAWNTLLKAKQPSDRFVKVEALRYLHLRNGKKKSYNYLHKYDKLTLLLLGDYVPELTHMILNLLNSMDKKILMKYNVLFKTHPATTISLKDYTNINLTETAATLSHLLSKADVVFSTIMTSAAVETYLVGLPTIILLDSNTLKFNPLRDESGVYFISNKNQLQNTLINMNYKQYSNNLGNYFWTNPKLPRWKKLLEL